MHSEFGSDILDQHGEFVRQLARALLREPHLADDVAQEAWLHWFTRPPADRSRPRAWLSRVTSGLAHNRRRSERRRADIEGALAPAESTRSTPLDSCLETERIERVVAAVGALEAPYRELILARYFHGRSMHELVRAGGTNEETLRSRERRALEQLRVRLDRDFGGREAWAVGLGLLGRRGASASLLGTPAVGLAGAVLVTLGGFALWMSRDAAGATITAQPATPVATLEAPGAGADPSAREALAHAAGATATRSGGSGSSTNSSLTSTQAELRATFLLHDGRPAAGADWSLSGWGRTGEEPRAEEWSDRGGTLDASGTLVQTFTPPPEFVVSLDVKAPGHPWVAYVWLISPGQQIDLGTVTLPRSATITGRLVDPAGAPILGQDWTIGAGTVGLRGNGAREDTNAGAKLDPATGTFRIEDVHPGRNRLRADSRIGLPFEGPLVEVAGGETLDVELVYRGPSVADRITVSTSCAPFIVLDEPEAEHVRLWLPDGSTRTAQRDEGLSSRFSFTGVAPGSYRLEIDDPRFLPFYQDDVTPGSEVRARLEPGAELRLAVEGPSGEALLPERIEVEFPGVNFFPSTFVVHDGTRAFEGSVRLFPGDCLVHVEVDGARSTLAVQALASGEVRTQTLRLGTQPVLSGRLVRTNGAPLGAQEVLLLAPASVNDSDASSIQYPDTLILPADKVRRVLATTTSAEDGRFSFTLPCAGRYLVRAEVGNALPVTSPVQTLAEGEHAAEVELVVPLGVTVRGRILAPPDATAAGLRVWGGPPSLPMHTRATERASVVDVDGRFELDELPAGTLALRVLLPEVGGGPLANGSDAWSTLATLELADGVTHEQDFTMNEFPGTLRVDASVGGRPLAGLRLSATRQYEGTWQTVRASADPEGHFAPLALLAGSWSLRLESPERPAWAARLAGEVHVPVAGQASASFAVETAAGTRRCLDSAGQPLARRNVFLRLDHPHEVRPFRHVTTDDDGRVSLTLATGLYILSLDATQTTSLTWTTAGPSTSDVRF